MGVFRSQTPRAYFCLTKSDYFSDSRLDLWAYPPFFSARIRAAFSMTDSRLSTVLSSHPASHISIRISASVNSISPNISLSSAILRASTLVKIFVHIPGSPFWLSYHIRPPFQDCNNARADNGRSRFFGNGKADLTMPKRCMKRRC